MAGRPLKPDHLTAQRAITSALKTADERRSDRRQYATCIHYAGRIVDELRQRIDTVDRKTDRAWRD